MLLRFVREDILGLPRRRHSKKRNHKAIRPKPVTLRVEQLEDRITPSGPGGGDGAQNGPFTPSGVLGSLTLNSGDSVNFNTTTGQYQIDGGTWQSGGILSPDDGQTTMLFNFTTINLAAGSTVTAFGTPSLGLLGTGNIVINTNLVFSGQAGGNGANGYGEVGGGGGGGGRGGGAVIIDTDGGTITYSALLNVREGAAGTQGQDQLLGGDSGGQGGAGGLSGVGGANGGSGGASMAGGGGGQGGNGADGGGGGGGGGGGVANGKGGGGGSPRAPGGGSGSGKIGGEGAAGASDVRMVSPSGGKGGNGGALATVGGTGGNGVAKKENCLTTLGGGGGGGGGGDADEQNKKPAKGGGPGGFGAGGKATDGKGGNPQAVAGAGGGGAFILVASQGITFSGTGEMGTGQWAVLGSFTNTGSFPDGLPSVNSYATWQSVTTCDYNLEGGAGGGGAGGDGQVPNLPTVISVSPNSGPTSGGTSVTISGTYLAAVYEVLFGMTDATSYTVNTNGTLTAVSPAESAGTVDITVISGGGTSPTSSADQFTFTSGGSAPMIASPLTRTNGSTGGGSALTSISPTMSSAGSVDLVRIAQILSTLDASSVGSDGASALRTSIDSGRSFYPAALLGSNMAGWANQTRMSESLQHSGHSEVQSLDAVFADLAGRATL